LSLLPLAIAPLFGPEMDAIDLVDRFEEVEWLGFTQRKVISAAKPFGQLEGQKKGNLLEISNKYGYLIVGSADGAGLFALNWFSS
jgi:hypothetical protein